MGLSSDKPGARVVDEEAQAVMLGVRPRNSDRDVQCIGYWA